MPDKDEGGGLFRRITRRVTGPARELVGNIAPRSSPSGSPGDSDPRPTEFDKAEMKAKMMAKMSFLLHPNTLKTPFPNPLPTQGCFEQWYPFP